MDKKEFKMHLENYVNSQELPIVKTTLVCDSKEDYAAIPVKIKQKLSTEEKIGLIQKVKEMCVANGDYYSSNFEFAFKYALTKYYTDIFENLPKKSEKVIFSFIELFDVEKFLEQFVEHIGGDLMALRTECRRAIDWECQKILNSMGVNGVFVKLNNLLEKVDMFIGQAGGSIDDEKINKLLEAVGVVSEAPEVVAEKVIEMERARVAEEIKKEESGEE